MSVPSSVSCFDPQNTSLDISEEDDEFLEPWENLLHYLTTNHLEKLRAIFKPEGSENQNLQLSKEQFLDAIDNVLGHSRYAVQAVSLFNEIPYPDKEKITWDQFLDYYIRNGIKDELNDIKLSEPEIFPVSHIKRETISKIVLLESNSWFCYAIISKYGKVGLYTGDLVLLTTYKVLFTRNDKNVVSRYRPRKTAWVTDAYFLQNVQILAICSSVRSLIFYDASGQRHTPLWLIEGIPNSIQCLEYHADVKSKLFMGDDFGTIFVLNFNQQNEGLLRKKHNDKLNSFYWKELDEESAFVTIDIFKNIHSNTVLSIIYYPHIYTFVSCSRDYKNSVVFFNVKDKQRTQAIKISQGVNCFSLSHNLHILITGNDSGVIFVWNLFVTTKPLTSLMGHKNGIVDIKILEYKSAAVSCARDGMLKVWDLNEYTCLKTIQLKYPCFGVLGKRIEWGASTFYPGPKIKQELSTEEKNDMNESSTSTHEEIIAEKPALNPWNRTLILITCCNYIAKLKTDCNENNSIMLPPPPMQNDMIIPDVWKIGDYELFEVKNVPFQEFDSTREIRIEENYFKNNLSKQDINYKAALMELKKSEMQKLVSQCAPYTALELHKMKEIQLSKNLPIPNNKKTQQLAERTHRLLSAASNVSDMLSARSSKSKSSRSSIVEF